MASLYKKRNVWYLSLSINNKRVTRSLNTKDYSIAKQLKPYIESSIIQELTGLVQKIAVMYAGTIVEMTTTRNLYKNTSHPYTLGLLQSLPTTANNIDDEKIRLIPIEGSPPNLLEEPSCCAFAPRCVYAVDKCWQDKPILDLVDDGHYVACWKWEAVRNRV